MHTRSDQQNKHLNTHSHGHLVHVLELVQYMHYFHRSGECVWAQTRGEQLEFVIRGKHRVKCLHFGECTLVLVLPLFPMWSKSSLNTSPIPTGCWSSSCCSRRAVGACRQPRFYQRGKADLSPGCDSHGCFRHKRDCA